MPLVLGVGLGLILTAFVAYGLSLLQHSQNTGLLGWLASTVENIALFGPRLAAHVLKLDAWITHYIGQHFRAVEGRAIAWLSGMRQYAGYMAAAAVAPAAAAYVFAQWLLSVGMPNAINARTADVRSTASQAKAYAQAALRLANGLEKAGPALPSVKEVPIIQRVAMPHAQEWQWINDHWLQLKAAVLNAAVLPIAHVLPRVEPIAWPYGLTPTRIRKRLRRVEGLLGVTGFAVIMARVLGVTAKCLRSGNISRVAKHLCGLPSSLIDDLLGLLVDLFLIENLCQVVGLLSQGLSIIQGPVDQIVGEVSGGLCGGKNKPPPAIGPFTLSTPPVTGYTLV